MTQAYPLQWPKGRPRTKYRYDSAFRVTPAQAYSEMMDELSRFGVSNIVVSTNIPLRQDGTPYRDGLKERLPDPGVAVFFTRKKRQVCLICDSYRKPWENIRALGKSVEAFRAMERHGASQVLDQAFEGFAALPPPGAGSDAAGKAWWVVLEVSETATSDEIKKAYRDLARKGGGASVELNAAYEQAKASLQ